MKKVKTLDCGYCPYEYCPVMESDGERICPYVILVPDEPKDYIPDYFENAYCNHFKKSLTDLGSGFVHMCQDLCGRWCFDCPHYSADKEDPHG